MTAQMWICLIIMVAAVISFLFLTKWIPMGLTAMCAMVLFSLTGCLDTSSALSGFANTSTILMGSMFVVSAAFNRTQFAKSLAANISRIAKGSFTKIMFGYALLTALLINFTGSPLATLTMVAPLLSLSCQAINISPSKSIFGMSILAVAVSNILPFSGAVNATAQWNGYMEAQGYVTYQANLMDHLIARWPILIFCIVYAVFVAPRLSASTPSIPIVGGVASKDDKTPLLKPFQERAAYIIFFATIIAFLFSSQLGLEAWQISMTGACLVLLTRVMSGREAVMAIPWNIMFLFAGCLSMGQALTSTGLGDVIGQALANVSYSIENPYLVGLLFYFVPFAMTQFMSNNTVMVLFQPLIVAMCKYMGANPIGLMNIVQQACLAAFMTPLATTSTPVAIAYGGYDLKDLVKQGSVPGVLIGLIMVFWTMTVMPMF